MKTWVELLKHRLSEFGEKFLWEGHTPGRPSVTAKIMLNTGLPAYSDIPATVTVFCLRCSTPQAYKPLLVIIIISKAQKVET